jgi:hypothetical protein
MKNLILIIMPVLLTVSCATQQFTVSEGSEVLKQNKFDHFFVEGIGQEAIVNAAEICRGSENVSKVERSTTFLNWFVSALSYGIYTPEQSRVYCKK